MVVTIRELYKRGVLLPAVISVAVTTVLAVVNNNDYKSEWLTKDSVVILALIASVVHSLIICLLALTIFFNPKIIKTVGVISFLSWFLLPISWMMMVVYRTIPHWPDLEGGTTQRIVDLITFNLPFIIGLVWTFIVYKKQLNHH